jgi:hypothetical protein
VGVRDSQDQTSQRATEAAERPQGVGVATDDDKRGEKGWRKERSEERAVGVEYDAAVSQISRLSRWHSDGSH